ncbi:hypothetical protein [Sulfurospirillum sp. 1612]|uniref:hypothetical protein n=1 Tax=Sulfurospirillum sp. 1612 TaxID=3094835 RepID=UPI002F9471CE
MVNTYNNSDTLASIFGFDTNNLNIPDNTGVVQQDDLSFFDWYDNELRKASISADDTLGEQELQQEQIKASAAKFYENFSSNIKNAIDTISSDLSIGKNVVIVGGSVLICLVVWNFIGRDIYQIAKKGK